MQMFRWMSEHTLRDKIQNGDIRKSLGIANIEGKIKINHLRLFGYVQVKVLVNC